VIDTRIRIRFSVSREGIQDWRETDRGSTNWQARLD
jgi:hypothetical protein